MRNELDVQKELKRLSNTKTVLIVFAVPIFLVLSFYLFTCLSTTNSFSYNKVLILISVCVTLIVIIGQTLFYTLKDENRIKDEMRGRQ